MDISNSIRLHRNKSGLTQKQLAEKLNVTPQAVSRWEKGIVEPDISTLKQMAEIFDVSVVELIDGPNEGEEKSPATEDQNAQAPESSVSATNVTSAQPEAIVPKVVVAMCEVCHEPIYGGERICSSFDGFRNRVVCSKCKKAEEQNKENNLQRRHKQRWVRGWSWATVSALAPLILMIICIVSDPGSAGIFCALFLPITVVLFCFVFCLLLNNTGVFDVALTIWSWGAVRMPGIIFSLDFDGIVFLIVTKILFAVTGFCLFLLAFLLGSAIGGVCAIFAFPIAIIRWKKGYKYDND